jgi:diphosphomevalonate decarboxylase
MKAKAIAHPNIAVVKYWGKADDELRLPVNSSVSITLDKLWTKTEVEFDKNLTRDMVEFKGSKLKEGEELRIIKHLNRVRKLAQIDVKAQVKTENNFKKASGMASSASGFAALSLAASQAAGLRLSKKELSELARQGSGSACRSIPGGVAVWRKGEDSKSSVAYKLEFQDRWKLRILLVEVNQNQEKKVKSTEGMAMAKTSSYYEKAVKEAEENVRLIIKILKQGEFEEFGKIVELECFRLRKLTETSKPKIVYWQKETHQVIDKVRELREKERIEGYVTIDAGPHVHVICRQEDEKKLLGELKKLKGVKEVISCGVGGEARLLA